MLRHWPCASLTLLASSLALGQGQAAVDLAQVDWIHGAGDCAAARAEADYVEWQQVRYTEDTYLFRQNKCSDYEGPFVYLFIGAERSLLIDTGATKEGGTALLAAVRALSDKPLIVAHSHGHGDHVQGDDAFLGRPDVEVVGGGAEAVQHYFGFTGWPEQEAWLDLGGRRIGLLPIPGHTDDDLAYYDARSAMLVTGDTLYPGRLYVRNWNGYRASIARLLAWTGDKTITQVLGTHIEMSASPDIDYPVGTVYQPDERALPLSVSDLARLHEALQKLDEPERHYLGDFIVWPL